MHFRIDDKEFPADLFTYAEMNFNQVNPRLPLRAYSIEVPIPEFEERFAEAFKKLVEYEKREEGNPFRDEAAELIRWRSAGYPPISALAKLDPDVVDYLVRKRMLWSMLKGLMPPSAAPRFVVSTLDRVRVTLNSLLLEGRGFPLG